MNRGAVVTCVTSNHLGYARALVGSIRRFEPTLPVYVVIADGNGEDRIDAEHVFCVTGFALGIPDWKRFAFQYTAFELSCALKPFALTYLLKCGHDAAVYLDADMYVCSNLKSIADELVGAEILLSPHAFSSPVSSSKTPGDLETLSRGVYNAGFLAVRRTVAAESFLRWWATKCLKHCYVDTRRGVFVDQCWLNFAPIQFPECRILRIAGVNVAYWNLHERDIRVLDNKYAVNGQELVCFHFSGFDYHTPSKLSRHQPSVRLDDGSAVSRLAQEYANFLGDQLGDSAAVYRFANLSDGTPIRAAWREAVRVDHPRLQGIPDPFDVMKQPDLKRRLCTASTDAVHGREEWRATGMRLFFYRIAKLPLIRRIWLYWVERELVHGSQKQ